MVREHDYDWLVVGSGFGGSVSALRLREKGYSVGVLECGRRFEDDDFPNSTWDVRRYFWAPRLGMRGIFRLSIFKDVAIVSGAGVGGGSLGYANTLYRARRRFYEDAQWAGLDDWEAALAPHYDEAERMLGVVAYDQDDPADDLLREFAREIGVEDTYAKTRVGVLLDGKPGQTHARPVLRRRRAGPHGVPALRALHDRLPARRQEHAREELPVAGRARRRRGVPRAHGGRRPAARRGRRLGGLRDHHRAAGRVAAAPPPHVHRPRRGVRRRAARHQPAARRVQAARLAAARSRTDRQARAHELGGDPRGHAAARRAGHPAAGRDHRLDLSRSRDAHRDRRLRRRGRLDELALHGDGRRRHARDAAAEAARAPPRAIRSRS